MNAPHAHALPLRASVAAVQAALVTLFAMPAAQAQSLPQGIPDATDPAVAELVERDSRLEVGAGMVSSKSYKANEYTGIYSKQLAVGGFELRGGARFGSDDQTRWRLFGSDLGTDSRSLGGEYTEGSGTKIFFGWDELRRNRSDSYQTPLQGAGSSVLTLPSSWRVPLVPQVSGTAANARGLSPTVTGANGLVNGAVVAPSAAQQATAAAIQAADLPAFQHVNLYTQRKAGYVGLSNVIDSNWDISASIKHEDKTGLKPMGTVTRVTGGDISTVIPDLINQTTEQFNAAVRFHQDALSLRGEYYGSLFTNNVPSMTWSNWARPTDAQTMSSAPSNEFHQLGLTGSYDFSPKTHLVANASYARNTQNSSYLTSSYTPLVPVSSLSGLVVTKTFNTKLTSRPVKDLNVSAGYKFDERDNRTPVNTYGFYDAGEAAAATSSVFQSYYPGTTLASNTNLNANRPYSRRSNQINLDGDYRIIPGQSIKAGLDAQQIDRYCSGSWISCVDADKTKETTSKLEWRLNAFESVSARLGLNHSIRTVHYNEDAWLALVPAANLSPTGAPAGSSVYSTMLANGWTGYGPISGLNPLPTAGSANAFFFANNNVASNALYGNQNRISELPGMRRYNMADRTRDKFRSAIDWQVTEQFSLQAGFDYNRDNYSNSVYGLTKASGGALNLDGTLALSESSSVTLFASHEEQRSTAQGNSYTANATATAVNGFTAVSGNADCNAAASTIAARNAQLKTDSCLNWSANMRDRVDTLGVGFVQRSLMGGKLGLSADLSYSRAVTTNDVSGGNYANNPLAVTGAAAGTVAAFYIKAAALPEVVTNIVDLKLGARWAFDKQSAVRVGYRFQYLSSTDWAYDGMQYGGLSGVLPTLEQSPSYRVHSVSAAYLYTFR